MAIPNNLGVFTADGGLYLNPSERQWLAELLSRADTASCEVSVDSRIGMAPPKGWVEDYIANGLADVVSPFAEIASIPQNKEDEGRCRRRIRGTITIIKGGIPPRPAF